MIAVLIVVAVVGGLVWEFADEIERFIDDIRGRGE